VGGDEPLELLGGLFVQPALLQSHGKLESFGRSFALGRERRHEQRQGEGTAGGHLGECGSGAELFGAK
jgi:hypothetical protein